MSPVTHDQDFAGDFAAAPDATWTPPAYHGRRRGAVSFAQGSTAHLALLSSLGLPAPVDHAAPVAVAAEIAPPSPMMRRMPMPTPCSPAFARLSLLDGTEVSLSSPSSPPCARHARSPRTPRAALLARSKSMTATDAKYARAIVPPTTAVPPPPSPSLRHARLLDGAATAVASSAI
ncbi:hypothetical protein AMAG_09431 [Allomyces macrogynus ATCC 38327]|uniref:Uncharacterized protein n=1 Tax=Allomyces macrogynus (strain ATCC 38327) TaxID=578462 RepID=A0A0L0SPH6_ALLM3|nr:hypothetical protein AMAG_09431 [Allomyces macrogynus ATCC 38327]|eukprot:KNE64408.1 hypothetical protein AMAG_09431 [Allomyces macrogynus ATCC 38327]